MNSRSLKKTIAFILFLLLILGTTYAISRNADQKKNHSKKHPQTGLLTNPQDTYEGFTIFGESGSAKIKLVNMSGTVVKEWPIDAARSRLLPNCHLLVVHGTKWGWSQKQWDALRPFVREYRWDGSVAWEYEAPGPAHHDVQRLKNGNTLIVYRGLVPNSAKQTIEDPIKRHAKIRTDIIQEITPSGDIAWEWKAHEHLNLNSCGKDPCPPLADSITGGSRVFDWTHTNGISVIPENRWFKNGDTRFTPGNIIVTLRNWSTVLVISKATGEVTWRYDENLSGGHEGMMISEDLPGAGDMLLFNNGRDQKRSQVIELNPTTKAVVWRYETGTSFFSRVAGVAQRLPNGNTLISEDVPGKIFEVTPDGNIAWSYQAEMRTARAHRYAVDTCSKLQELSIR